MRKGIGETALILLGTALPAARQIIEDLRRLDHRLLSAEISGDLARGEETVDIITLVGVTDDTFASLETFLTYPAIEKVNKQRDYKVEVALKNGLEVEYLSIYPEQRATVQVLYVATRAHRSQLRDLAWKRGYELTLGGFLKGEDVWTAKDEEEVYRYLGLPFIPPELRKGNGEIEAIQKGEMALDLVTLADIKGDLHVRTDWSDGTCTLEEIARAAIAKNYRYVLIADQTKRDDTLHGITPERWLEQRLEIYRLNELLAKEGHNFQLLSGVEVEILDDGSLNFPAELLAEMDIVLAAMHSGLDQERRIITERLMKAMSNPYVDIIAHPTGRSAGKPPVSQLNLLKIFVHARETGTILEINGHPTKLDLNAEQVQTALDEEVKLMIGSSAHSVHTLDNMEYGVITARKGAARVGEILNTFDLVHLKANIKTF
jgi:DNA polymerase (family 10)